MLPTTWGREHAVRMSAGCVQIGGGFAHVAETQNAAPTRDAMSEWGQCAITLRQQASRRVGTSDPNPKKPHPPLGSGRRLLAGLRARRACP